MSARLIPSRVLPLFSLVVLAACGSPPEAKTPPAPPPVAQTPKDPPVDVSPVPEPANLVVLARVNRPEQMVKTVGDWAHLPMPGAKELVRSIANDAIADILDTSQPFDVAGTLNVARGSVDPQYAFALGVKSFDDAKSKIGAKYKLDPVTNGGFKIHGLLGKGPAPSRDGDSGDNSNDDDDVCVLAHAAAGAKLVCGNNSGVDTLTPYLSRTMPRKEWPADVHIEVHPDPLRGPLGDFRGMLPMLAKQAIGANSAAVNDMITATVNEAADLLEDSQRLTLDAMVAGTGVTETTRWEFQGNKSVLARSLTDAGRADTAPAAFWHLPAETDTAVFMRGSDPKLYEHPREMLTNLMMEGMDSGGMPDAEKKAVHDLVADRMLKVFMDGGTGIFARGFDQAQLDKAIKDRAALGYEDWNADHEGQRLVGEQIVGWNLYQVGEPIAQVGPILKDWSSLWNRPAFAKWVETKTGTDKKEMPRMRVTPAPAGVTLPKDAVHLEVTFPPEQEPKWASARPGSSGKPAKKSAPPKAIVAHIYAVPDGGSTWIAFGLDGKLVGTKVAQSLASAPDTNSLGKAGPSGLDDLKNGKLNGGGFASMRGLLVATAMERGNGPSMFQQVANLPKKGSAPIVFTGRAEAPSPTARNGANTSSIHVSRDVIDDIVKLVFANSSGRM